LLEPPALAIKKKKRKGKREESRKKLLGVGQGKASKRLIEISA